MLTSLKKKITSREAVIGIIGMGNIGLALLEAFAHAGFPLVGYDKDKKKVDMLKNQHNYLSYVEFENLFSLIKVNRFEPSHNPDILKKADIIIISVTIPLDKHLAPDLTNLKKGSLVILQSSTYPGTTEKKLLPFLENPEFKVGKDFSLAYVPENYDPGNHDFSFFDIPRLVSGITPTCLEIVSLLYNQIGTNVIPCPSPTIAEAAKLFQNSYRMVNISFVNEMKIMFDNMDIDVWDIIKAAATKPFGFTPFRPSAGAGGDCIPVCPEYLIWEAKETNGPTTILETAIHINESMPKFVVDKIVEGLIAHKKNIHTARILILGVSYKKDVNDIRNSAALKILSLLKKIHAEIYYHDPFIETLHSLPFYPNLELKSINLEYEKLGYYDAVVVVTNHSFYNWIHIMKYSQLVVDTCNATSCILTDKDKIIKA